MQVKIFTVDAFADQPFSGNPAAVVPLTQKLEEDTLQKLAQEMNLSETAYVAPVEDAEGGQDIWADRKRFSLRWLTPTNEVALCGHATLATAHVLFSHFGNNNNHLEFETKSGILMARKSNAKIILDFPSNAPEKLHPTLQADLESVVKATTGNLVVKELLISEKAMKLLVVLDESHTREDLESLRPDTGLLMSLHDGSIIKGVIVSLRGRLPVEKEAANESLIEKQYHVLSRYFAPWNGIPEDPVTGSAHTVLGPYWSKHLGLSTLMCRQCSPRGGDVEVTIRDDGRVDLAGRAVTLIQGDINI